eukprot:403348000
MQKEKSKKKPIAKSKKNNFDQVNSKPEIQEEYHSDYEAIEQQPLLKSQPLVSQSLLDSFYMLGLNKFRNQPINEHVPQNINLQYQQMLLQQELNLEMCMFRSFTFSLLFVITLCFILYMNYLLLGQFFFCLFLAQISASSLRIYKQKMINYFADAWEYQEFLLIRCWLYLIIREVYRVIRNSVRYRSLGKGIGILKENIEYYIQEYQDNKLYNRETIFNDFSTVYQTMNQYMKLTVEYLQNNTALQIPNTQNDTQLQDLLNYVNQLVQHPSQIHPDFPEQWKQTITENTQTLKNSFIGDLIPRHFMPHSAILYTILQQYDITQLAKQTLNIIFKVNSSIFQMVIYSVTNLLSFISSLSNIAFNVILYFTILTYLLQDDNDLIDKVITILPLDDLTRKRIYKSINDSIKGVFQSNVKIAFFQAIYTWLLFDLFKVQYIYLYCLLASFFKIVPIVQVTIFGLVGGLQLYFLQEKPLLHLIMLPLIYAYLDTCITNDIYIKEIRKINPYLLGMSVFMGYYAFDLQGIFYGPLLVTIGFIIYELFNQISSEAPVAMNGIQNNHESNLNHDLVTKVSKKQRNKHKKKND